MSAELMPVTKAQIRVLLALLDVYEMDGRATVRSVAMRAGRSPMTVHKHLTTLARLGLATWDEGTRGTLHPCVTRTPVRSTIAPENLGGPGVREHPGPDRHLTGGTDDGAA